MNWKEIDKKYPKSFNLFFKWFKGDPKASMTKKEFLECNDIVIFCGDIRDLYDFFDDQGIYIEIMLLCEGWSPSLSKSCEEHYIKENKELGFYKLRSEAEEAVWLKAFEILEKKI